MNLDLAKRYLQNYLDSILGPRVNELRKSEGLEPVSFSVDAILKGSYQPPIIHIFLGSDPVVRKKTGLKPHAILMMSKIDKDISDFMKMLSIDYRIKVHWNQTPNPNV